MRHPARSPSSFPLIRPDRSHRRTVSGLTFNRVATSCTVKSSSSIAAPHGISIVVYIEVHQSKVSHRVDIPVVDRKSPSLVNGDSGSSDWATVDGFCECRDAERVARCEHSLAVVIAA